MLDWLGKFHLLILHFPIALIVFALILECLHMGVREMVPVASRGLLWGSRLALIGAALFAAPTALLGWFHANSGYGSAQPDTLFWHRWLGTGIPVVLATVAVVSELDSRRRWQVTFWVILCAAIVTGVCAHLGGMLVHGADFLNWR